MGNLLQNDTVTRALSRSIAEGDVLLGHVPGLLKRVITENMWQKRILPETGETVEFRQFEDFVTTPPLEGLGTSLDVVKSLCKRDPDVLMMIEQVTKKTLNKNGRPVEETIMHNSLSPSQQGTSREYTVARLERDGHAELAQAVLNREITAAEARRRAGYEHKRPAINANDPQSAANTILKTMEPDAVKELIAILLQSIND